MSAWATMSMDSAACGRRRKGRDKDRRRELEGIGIPVLPTSRPPWRIPNLREVLTSGQEGRSKRDACSTLWLQGMLFHTWPFVASFLVFYVGYLAVRKTRLCDYWLLAGSYGFYACWSPYFLLLILFTTTVDYLAVAAMARSARKKPCLLVSILCNLGVLGFFKYNGFAIQNLNALGLAIPDPGVALPVGISFYTFRSLSYTIDCYRGQLAREPSFIRYAIFVSFFPQLVAGPIERASHLLPQIRRAGQLPVNLQGVSDGLSIFVVGLFKKVALADALAEYVDKFYDAPAAADGSALLMATFAFAWQIYFDFSGYTDMARGVSRMMGFDLMLNFNNPYLATDFGDFWRRWHISLSSWFKDYVYIPLGGNRAGALSTYRNMALTMVISGLWHGAAWTFVIWGAVHALGRFLTREMERTAFHRERVPTLAKQVFVFVFVCFAWIFFRAATWADAMLILRKIATGGLTDPRFPLFFLAL
ncbi:MAG: MBOAT family protein, partial [Planctomycetes bacterium]|nr:MBOAT family protein [Planctomycetota bacterium]